MRVCVCVRDRDDGSQIVRGVGVGGWGGVNYFKGYCGRKCVMRLISAALRNSGLADAHHRDYYYSAAAVNANKGIWTLMCRF